MTCNFVCFVINIIAEEFNYGYIRLSAVQLEVIAYFSANVSGMNGVIIRHYPVTFVVADLWLH